MGLAADIAMSAVPGGGAASTAKEIAKQVGKEVVKAGAEVILATHQRSLTSLPAAGGVTRNSARNSEGDSLTRESSLSKRSVCNDYDLWCCSTCCLLAVLRQKFPNSKKYIEGAQAVRRCTLSIDCKLGVTHCVYWPHYRLSKWPAL